MIGDRDDETMNKGAMRGVKVIDFGRVLVGPVIGKYLALHGATVIRVESHSSGDLSRASGPFKDNNPRENSSAGFSNTNCNKYGVSLNLKHPKGKELAKKLVAWADIIIENSSTGTMDKLGLGYEDLKKVKPDIIMVSSTAQGQTGPHAHHPGWAIFMFALTGISGLTGWPGQEPPYPMALYPDMLPPRFAVIGALAALDHRRRTGKGQHLQLSQLETCAYLLAPLLLDYQVNQRVAKRSGSRCDWASPHGVYRCKGDDRWCAITIMNEVQWKSFCQVIGKPEWIDDPMFASLSQRKQNEDILDHQIELWTIERSPEDVMELMQNANIPAGRVSNGEDLYCDPQLRTRGHFLSIDHPHIGRHSIEDAGFTLSRTPTQLPVAGPDMGQHNEYVFCQLLGLSSHEFLKSMDEGVFD